MRAGAAALSVAVGLGALAGSGCIRGDVSADGGSGATTATLQDLNGGLALPGVPLAISPNAVATTPKVLIRSETVPGGPPNCLYGVYAADPRYLSSNGDAGQPNNGLVIAALGDTSILNSDPKLGLQGRTTCPDSLTYVFGDGGVGGAIPDNVQIGDTLQVVGELAPYCDSYNKQAAECATPIFPEFIASQAAVLSSGGAPEPQPVAVTDIEDGANVALDYAGMLVQINDVVTVNASADSNGSIVVRDAKVTGGPATAGLWVTTLSTTATLPQSLGLGFTQITGVLHFITGHWRLQPRSSADITPADAG